MYDLLIDLDNTVYPETSQIFSQIDKKMKEFISQKLNISISEAYKIQKKYFRENGTTLRGLMLYHDVEPSSFLKYVHDISITNINEDKKLEVFLKNYTGKKIIFTNGTKEHAQRVLKKVSIISNIDSIFDIVDAGYIPKPYENTYKKIISKYGLKAENTAMLDDIPINLKTAKKLGLTTILIKKGLEQNSKFDYIDIISDNLLHGLETLNKRKVL